MFTIEHDFDATVITLVDEGAAREEELREDIIITAFEDCVTLRQFDPMADEEVVITLSLSQLNDVAAALDLPEGVYRLHRTQDKRGA
jgi:transcriptional/translational regulatory protein YebC/TACO1